MEFQQLDPAKGEPPAELSAHFQGQARLQRLASPFEHGPAVFAVHFESGARTRPHVHRAGQVLCIASGEGIIANRHERRVVRAGEVVTVMPDEWHWHGGGPTTAMTHVTVQMSGPDEVDWDVDEGDWAVGYDAGP